MKTENGAMPKKNMLSLQIDLSKFEPATEEEKAQHEIQRESTTFFRDGMRKLFKNPLAVGSMIVLLVLLVTIVVAPLIVPYSYSGMVTVNGKRDKTAKNLPPMTYSKMEQEAIDRDALIAQIDKPSITRIDRIAETPPGYLGTAGRIGRLAEVDIEAIKAILLEIVR